VLGPKSLQDQNQVLKARWLAPAHGASFRKGARAGGK
jgi:hypothetical protein